MMIKFPLPVFLFFQLTVQDFILNWLDSFIQYLKQNLLLFLNVPKYTDSRSHYRFKDYLEYEDGLYYVTDDNVFIYNQSQNPSSGNRGICCITMVLINTNKNASYNISFEDIFMNKNFKQVVASEIIKPTGKKTLRYLRRTSLFFCLLFNHSIFVNMK